MKKETLEAIHELLAADMLERLTNGSVTRDKEGELVAASLTAAELNVIRQFLKDNGIDKVVDSSKTSDPFADLVKRGAANVVNLRK